MIVKWISCSVSEEMSLSFDIAQQVWGELSSVQGFVAQIGGWNQQRADHACILGVWENTASYQRFMEVEHDVINAKNNQAVTIDMIDVALFEKQFDIPGEAPSWNHALDAAGCLRVAKCLLKYGREKHFLSVQKELWNPGMRAAGGILGGMVSLRQTEQGPEYLISSFWRDKQSHQHYMKSHFPELRNKARVEEDVLELEGAFCRLESHWKVLGNESF